MSDGAPRPLVLTTKLAPGLKLGGYDTMEARGLVEELGPSDAAICIDQVPRQDYRKRLLRLTP